MKTHSVLNKAVLLGSVGAAIFAASVQAQYTSANGDVIIGFREENAGVRGTSDIVVDLGSYSRFITASGPILLGGTHSSEAYGGVGPAISSDNRFANSDVVATFGDLNNVFASAFGINTAASPSAFTSYVLTRARTSVGTQSTPLQNNSTSSQGTIGNVMDQIRRNPAAATGTSLSTTAFKENGVGSPYGTLAPIAGTTEMELTTGSAFTGGAVVRMDLYNLIGFARGGTPADAPYLGYFEYQDDGDLWFVPVPEASTYGLVAGAGLLLVALRRQLGAKAV